MKEDFLDEKTRAEDILLGSLGFAEEAKIITLRRTDSGYEGEGSWSSGENFTFSSEDDLDDLQEWALRVLLK